MKIMLLTLLFPILCFGQSEKANSPTVFQDSIPKTSFYLKDRRVIFQKVYASNLTQKELSAKIDTLLNTIDGFCQNFDGGSESDFYGRLCQYRFDMDRYGIGSTNWPSASNILRYPIDAKVTIQVKDYKYRVTITEISSHYFVAEIPEDELLEKSLMEKDGKKLKSSKASIKIAGYLNTDFSDLFNLKRSATASEF
jgi:hypothetical protein